MQLVDRDLGAHNIVAGVARHGAFRRVHLQLAQLARGRNAFGRSRRVGNIAIDRDGNIGKGRDRHRRRRHVDDACEA